jgi:hypothetical protein
VSSRVGGLFRRRSTSKRDDGGINGVWGPDTDEEEAAYQQNMGLRGGGRMGNSQPASGYNSEFDQGDESYFSVRQPPHQSNPYAPARPGDSLAMTGATPPTAPLQQQQQQQQQLDQQEFVPRPGAFHRTPTTLTAKQRKRAGAEEALAVNLQGALEVTLNVEISPRDPGGSTVPYRLVVPRLWYEDDGEGEDGEERERGEGLLRDGGGEEFPTTGEVPGEMVEKDAPRGLKRLISLRRRRTDSSTQTQTGGGYVPGMAAEI